MEKREETAVARGYLNRLTNGHRDPSCAQDSQGGTRVRRLRQEKRDCTIADNKRL
jgi:hypothetical protein